MIGSKPLYSSFRDPAGFLFKKNNQLYRQINPSYFKDYKLLIKTGLFKKLVKNKLIVNHVLVSNKKEFKIIKPALINFISYPYEWCFSQLKDAALLTLKIQKIALQHKMILKDATSFNIQFQDGQPILIDTLSFEQYKEGEPWLAYRQFCQHFLAPLTLMSFKDIRLNQLFKIYLDGIPLDLTSKLLPRKTWFNFGILTHIHLHNQSQQYFNKKKIVKNNFNNKMSFNSLLGLIENLEAVIKNIQLPRNKSDWIHYYQDNNYSKLAFNHKKQILLKWLKKIRPNIAWDLGANTGLFSNLASKISKQIVSFDNDPVVVEQNYLKLKKIKTRNILPLFFDITNPSPAIGWQNQERMTIFKRGPTEMVLALALVHHLAIVNNLPLNKLAYFFSQISPWLIIEFIPKSDGQVQRMLQLREDIFPDYNKAVFEQKFTKYFLIIDSILLRDSSRRLYLMKEKS